MLRVEFHCHTRFSGDSLAEPKALLAACQRRQIDRLIITDHNRIDGARAARELDPQRVIVGEEIMTTAGELLAAFVTEQVPAGLPPFEAIRRLRDQGAFISVSHPFDTARKGHWDLPDLLAIAPLVDAIETFNARCTAPQSNEKAQAFAQEHHLPGTVGSDAHAVFELGNATLLLPDFSDAPGLKGVIRQGKAQTRMASPFVHFVSRYAHFRKRKESHG
jgi:predicted metal-dependent phosphoesterase TrpH